jgi:hypothetical protein
MAGNRWSFADSLLIRTLADGRAGYIRRERFPVGGGPSRIEQLAEALGRPIFLDLATATSAKALVRAGDVLALIAGDDGHIEIAVAGERASVEEVIARTREAIAEHLPASGLVGVTFWWHSAAGPRARRRVIDVPTWEDAVANYPAETARVLDDLMAAAEPPDTGRLLLWHGPPGTGKSFALRALLDAWSGWCAPSFVTDPDRLFGESAEYLASLMVAEDHGYARPWRLLILEDAGEFMSLDARNRSGQGLSRLLNVADGLLGQGARTLMLITTNEPLARVHPAVHRAGRCWADVEFPLLSLDEANAWLAARSQARRVTAPVALAELFATRQASSGRRDAGFGFGFAAA